MRISSPTKTGGKKRDVQMQLPVTLLSSTIESDFKPFEAKHHYPATGPSTSKYDNGE